jgi:hypothetical protein
MNLDFYKIPRLAIVFAKPRRLIGLEAAPNPETSVASGLPLPKGEGWGEGEEIVRQPIVCVATRPSVHGKADFPEKRKLSAFSPRRIRILKLFLIPLVLAVYSATGQPQLVTNETPQKVFAGRARQISVTWKNSATESLQVDLHTRIYQTSSATAVRVEDSPWKKLQILPGQTVLETAQFDFPSVRGETPFLLQWLDAANKVLGKTEVLVYPPDLLKDLKDLIGDEPLGIYDPQNQLKPELKAVSVEYFDLEDLEFERFDGKLAIIGPMNSTAQMGERFTGRLKALAQRGVAVVWLQPVPEQHAELRPSFYTVREGKGAVVVVQPSLVPNLSDNPQSQLNLLRLARLAVNPEPPQF